MGSLNTSKAQQDSEQGRSANIHTTARQCAGCGGVRGPRYWMPRRFSENGAPSGRAHGVEIYCMGPGI